MQEGNYASSDTSSTGEINRTDLGLTLLPGSQIQRDDDEEWPSGQEKIHQEQELLIEPSNGCEKGLMVDFGECALRGKGNQDVETQEKDQAHALRELEDRVGPGVKETTFVPALGSSDRFSTSRGPCGPEPQTAVMLSTEEARPSTCSVEAISFSSPVSCSVGALASTVSCSVNVRVSDVLLTAAGNFNESKAIEPAQIPVDSVEGKAVGFFDSAKVTATSADDGSDDLHPCKRQKTDKDVPCSLTQDVETCFVTPLDLVENGSGRGWSAEDGGVNLSAAQNPQRSRSHNSANHVARAGDGPDSEPHGHSPRSTSSIASETGLRSLETPESSGVSLSHQQVHPLSCERSYSPVSTPQPLPSHTEPSDANCASVLHGESPAMSYQPFEPFDLTASTPPTVCFPESFTQGGQIDSTSQPERARNEEEVHFESLASATATSSVARQATEEEFIASISDNPLLALPTYLGDWTDTINTADSNMPSLTQNPFADSFNWPTSNSIDDIFAPNNTLDEIFAQAYDQPVDTTLPSQAEPLRSQEAYQSPYDPQSRRLEELLNSQTKEKINSPIIRFRNPFERTTAESITTGVHSTAYNPLQVPHRSGATSNTMPQSRSYSEYTHAAQSDPHLFMPSRPSPYQKAAPAAKSRVTGTSVQISSEADETSSESTSGGSASAGSLPPAERFHLAPELVNTAKKGLHAITSVVIERIHNTDLIPRVVSFIKTFPLSGNAPPLTSGGSSADCMDLLYKNQSLLERNAELKNKCDNMRKATRKWTTKDPGTGLTKGQSTNLELRRLRAQLAEKTDEAERWRTAYIELDASRTASYPRHATFPVQADVPHGYNGGSQHNMHISTAMQTIETHLQHRESAPFSASFPTPPVSQRVSIDLTEGTPQPPRTYSAPQPSLPQYAAPPPEAAALRATMKRKAYSWLPNKSNHMVKKPRPAAPGTKSSMPIELDAAGPAFDAEAELEAELERELLASQQAEERERDRRAAYNRRRTKQRQMEAKDRRAKAAASAAKTGLIEEEQRKLAEEQRRVEEEEQREEVEVERPSDEELFGSDGDGWAEEAVNPPGQVSSGEQGAGVPTTGDAVEESSEESEEE